jgi:hypothetical protein
MSTSEEIISKVEEILGRESIVEGRHSFFQLQHFVVNSEPTTQSRMWQCVRELRKRREVIEQISLELEETKDNITILELEIKKLKFKDNEIFRSPYADKDLNMLERDLIAVKKRQLERRRIAQQRIIDNLQKTRQENLDEAALFLKSFEALERIEPLKAFDDPDSQRQYWNGKLTNDLNLKLLLQQPIDIELAKTIMALPNDVPVKNNFIFLIDQSQKKMSERSPTRKIEAK